MGKKWKQWQILFSWTPKSLQISWLQPWNWKTLSPWKESYDKPRQHIKKQRHPFADKGLCPTLWNPVDCSTQGFPVLYLPQRFVWSKLWVFSGSHVWMWELDHKEGWALKNDAFELWCWRRLLRIPWTARRSNQPILKKISPEYSLEGLLLKLQYFGLLMWRAHSLKKTLMLRKIEVKRRRGQQRMRWLVSITGSMDVNLSKLQKIMEERGGWHAAVHGVAKNRTLVNNWTTITESHL